VQVVDVKLYKKIISQGKKDELDEAYLVFSKLCNEKPGKKIS